MLGGYVLVIEEALVVFVNDVAKAPVGAVDEAMPAGAVGYFAKFLVAPPVTEHFTLLGAWDSEPERGIMSYLSPLAQALLNKKVSEEIDFEMDSVPKRYRVDAIELHAPALTTA